MIRETMEFINNELNHYGRSNVAVLSSFGKDSLVLLHLIRRLGENLKVLWAKTPFLPEETINLARNLEESWNLDLITVESEKAEDQGFMRNVVNNPNLPKTAPERCCEIFKVEPIMKRVNELELDAWFSGLRGTESDERSFFERSHKQGSFTKLHPLLNWTEKEIWNYIKENKLPTHPWYNNGYRSIGCAPCSSPAEEEESERDGRWRGTRMCGGSCGLHKIPPR